MAPWQPPSRNALTSSSSPAPDLDSVHKGKKLRYNIVYMGVFDDKTGMLEPPPAQHVVKQEKGTRISRLIDSIELGQIICERDIEYGPGSDFHGVKASYFKNIVKRKTDLHPELQILRLGGLHGLEITDDMDLEWLVDNHTGFEEIHLYRRRFAKPIPTQPQRPISQAGIRPLSPNPSPQAIGRSSRADERHRNNTPIPWGREARSRPYSIRPGNRPERSSPARDPTSTESRSRFHPDQPLVRNDTRNQQHRLDILDNDPRLAPTHQEARGFASLRSPPRTSSSTYSWPRSTQPVMATVVPIDDMAARIEALEQRLQDQAQRQIATQRDVNMLESMSISTRDRLEDQIARVVRDMKIGTRGGASVETRGSARRRRGRRGRRGGVSRVRR